MEEKRIIGLQLEPDLFPLFEPIRCWCPQCEGKVLSRDEMCIERRKGGIEFHYSSGDYEIMQEKWIRGKQKMEMINEDREIRIKVCHYRNNAWINIELVIKGWEVEIEKWEKEEEEEALTQWNFRDPYEILNVVKETLRNIKI